LDVAVHTETTDQTRLVSMIAANQSDRCWRLRNAMDATTA
jgi:hypothetical protein